MVLGVKGLAKKGGGIILEFTLQDLDSEKR